MPLPLLAIVAIKVAIKAVKVIKVVKATKAVAGIAKLAKTSKAAGKVAKLLGKAKVGAKKKAFKVIEKLLKPRKAPLKNWRAAETKVRKIIKAPSNKGKMFKFGKTNKGSRVVDAWKPKGKVAGEAKYGKAKLNKFIQNQINKDAKLLKSREVKSVEWHFFKSAKTGTGGPTAELAIELVKKGIKIIIH